MIILIEGDMGVGKTYLCREYMSATNGRACINDSSTRVEVDEICRRRIHLPHDIIIITGDHDTIEYAEQKFRAARRAEPIVRLELKEPTL